MYLRFFTGTPHAPPCKKTGTRLDPLRVGLVERLHRDEPHLPLLACQRNHQLLVVEVLDLEVKLV